ncbi:putative ribonuclease H-like domain-containing protein [Tanacetum coccineum]
MVVKHYEAKPIAGAGMMLWGDLHVLFESVEGGSSVEVWADQKDWVVRSWRLFPFAGVHVLETFSGTVLYMFADTPYPLSASTMKKCNEYSLKDKNEAKTDKTEHENGKSVKSQNQSQSQKVKVKVEAKDVCLDQPAPKLMGRIVPTSRRQDLSRAGPTSGIRAWREPLRKRTGRDPKGNIMILPPVSVKEHIAVQRKTNARTILLQSLPEDHMADFHHLDDARDIWLAVKARFGGNDESRKMRKSMLKQEFSEFRVSESEGLHKGYDNFQKILSQLNQMQAKPDNEDCNIKFFRALPHSWSQVATTLKTKGGLDYLSFDYLYNKLRTLEIDVKGGSSYDSRGTSAPTHSAFISAASTNSKMSYPDQSHPTTFTSASSSPTASSNVMENVLHSFVAESDPQQQITYEDFDQIGKLDLEELDIKWQMAMLSVRINRFEKKAGRKMKFNNKDAARYSSFKLKELDKTEEPKALLSVDSMLNWSDHEGEDVENGAAQVYGMIARAEEDVVGSTTGNAIGDVAVDVSNAAAEFALMGISSQVHNCPFGCEHLYAELKKEFDNVEVQYKECYIQVQAYKSTLQTLEQQKGWYQSNQLALEERIRILTANLENTTNMLKYTEKLNEQAKLEKLNDKVKLEESKARFDKWKDSSKNLDKLIHSSMSSRSKFGLGFGETFGSDEVFDPSGPSIFDTTPEDVAEKPLYDRFVKAVGMHVVPPPITGTFMPPSNNPDLDDTQFTYGSKSNNYFETNSVSNDFVSCDNSDKSSDSETTGFASCVSSVKSSSSKTNEPVASAPSSVAFQTMSETADQQPSSTKDNPSFSFKENVKPPRNLCNKSGVNSRSLCKRKSFGSKTCFVCGSKFHLIKDCDFYEKQLELQNQPMWNNVANIPSFVPKAASVPADSRNRQTSVPAGSRNRPASVPTGSRNRPTSVPAGRPFSAGWKNNAARPMTRPTSHYFQHFSRPGYYNQMNMDEGRWGTAVKPSAECLVLSKEFQLPENSQVVLRVPRRNNLYCFNLSDIKPERDVTCLLAKASLVESTKWHRRMAHVNFKNMNKLAKHGLVNGLPSKLFTNEHNCVACNKGKQHKASYKAITAVSTISAPLQLLHMDLFGPTSIRSIDHKYYSLVVTDDFSRFTWVFFLGTKDETYGILKDFITFIENQLTKKVKAIRCDNGTEFKNSKLIELCGSKGIRRDYSNARTPQQNGVAERKNRTLIEAARTMLADSKLPTMFWTEAVSTACYVLNRVLVTKPHNKTPYELVSGKVPNISHLKPFGCLVTILNTSDHLGKFEGKADEGFIIGYAAHSKAYRVYNLSSKHIEETLNLRYLEDKSNVQGLGHEWYFDLDYLTDSLGYTRFKTNQPAGTQDTNIHAGTQDDSDSECDEQVIVVPSFPSNSFSGPKVNEASEMMESSSDYAEELARLQKQAYEANTIAEKHLSQADLATSRNGVPAGKVVSAADVSAGHSETSTPVCTPVHTAAPSFPPGHSLGSSAHSTRYPSPSDLANSTHFPHFQKFTNIAPSVAVDPVPTKRVNISSSNHRYLVILTSPFQTRAWQLVPLPEGKFAIGTKWILKNKRDARVARIEAIRLFLAFASYMGFMVYQMDVKSAFLYGEIEEEVYVTQPKGFEDPHFPKHVYRVVKALYGLIIKHQRSCFTMNQKPSWESLFSQYNMSQDMLKKFDMENVPSQNLTASRPDIQFAVSACSRHQVTPLTSNLNVVKKIFNDSDYAGSHGDRKSTIGGCQFLGRRLISWQCKKQTIVATSSTEAEYVAAASCCGQEFLLVALNVPTGRTVPAGFGVEKWGSLDEGKLTFYKNKFSPQWRFIVHTIMHCLSTKSGSWDQFGSSLATALICLTEGRKLINHLRPNHPILASPQENEQCPFSDPNPASSSRPHPSEHKQFTSTNVEDDVFGGSFDISPPRSTEASPAGTTLGGAEDPNKLTTLCSLVNSLVQKIDSQASDLQAHKLVFKEVVGKLVKKVKELEDKLKGRKRKFVMTESDLKEEEEQDVDPLIKLAKAAATAADDSAVPTGGSNEDDIPPSSSIPSDESAIPPDVTTGPTDAPSDKGKSPMLGVEATRRLYEEEQAELAREREEQKKKRQKDVLKSVKYYTDADWNEIIERMVAMIAERRRKFAAQRLDNETSPITILFILHLLLPPHSSPKASSHPDVTADTSKQPSIAPTLPSGFSATPTVTRTSGPRTRN